ncbi:MAG: alanine--glyoxylate aminotransferase family protein [candidate division WOR-3 bacterium]|nr:alanine--glyoxylate aminotransferase family protein [candidate division WOR-3 bacterium]
MQKHILFTPGPTEVPPEVLAAGAQPIVHHRSPDFEPIFAKVSEDLKYVFQTQNPVVMFASSGTGAMEAAVSNLISRGDKALVVSCGKFGERWRELLIRYNAYVRTLTAPYGETVLPEELERKLKTDDTIKYVFTTLTETSTGALSDIKTYGRICHDLNRILVVDAVAGLGADEFQMDEFNVSVTVAASQKALFCPPGLSFLACNNQVWEIIKNNRSPRYYFDLLLYQRFAENGQTPWTPAISILYGLHRALKVINKKGIKTCWQEHKAIAEYTRNFLSELGLEIFPKIPSNALTVVKMPEGIDGTKIVEHIKNRYHFLLSNGQAELRGKIIRIGHMGYIKKTEITKVLGAFKKAYQHFKK